MRTVMMLLALAVATSACNENPAAGTCWQMHVVDSVGMVGYSPAALVVDGELHVTYYDTTNGDLKHARRSADGWLTEVVDADGNVGWNSSLAIDDASRLHVTYYDVDRGALKIAYQSGDGTWSHEVIDDDGDVGMYSALVFDPAGRAHVSYWDEARRDLRYAQRSAAGSWSVETVHADSEVGWQNDIGVDALGVVHIFYQHGSNGNLLHASRSVTGSWTLEVVDTEGRQPSAVAGADGSLHVAYGGVQDDLPILKYARFMPGSDAWTIEIADTDGFGPSLGVDRWGRVHVAHNDPVSFTEGILRYARRNVDGVWTTRVLDTGRAWSGLTSALTIDEHGVHLAFDGENPGDLDLLYTFCTLDEP